MRAEERVFGTAYARGEAAAHFGRMCLSVAVLTGLLLTPSLGFSGKAESVCTRPPHRPRICNGFIPPSHWGETGGLCPKNYAVYALDDPAGDADPEHLPFAVTCCPLPASDILLDEHAWSTRVCPSGFVATGVDNSGSVKRMRCTRVNEARYRLESARRFFYWGNGESGDGGAPMVSRSQIPLGFRAAPGRTGKDTFQDDGCVAGTNELTGKVEDWAGLLVSRNGKYCSQMTFRRLLFRGRGDDPRSGTVVPLFADCESQPDKNAPFPTCEGILPAGECEDGIDNDGDGLVDADDPGCACMEDGELNPDVQCDNGRDDDGDRLIDFRDPDCSGPEDNSEFPHNDPPTVLRLDPRWGESKVGEVVTFEATYLDGDGFADIATTEMLISTTVREVNAVWLRYRRSDNTLELADENGVFRQGCRPGAIETLENPFAQLSCRWTAVSEIQDEVTVQWAVSFRGPYRDQTHELFLKVTDRRDQTSGWVALGSWTVFGDGEDDRDDIRDGGIGGDGGDDGTITDPTRPDTRFQGGGCQLSPSGGSICLLMLAIILGVLVRRSTTKV